MESNQPIDAAVYIDPESVFFNKNFQRYSYKRYKEAEKDIADAVGRGDSDKIKTAAINLFEKIRLVLRDALPKQIHDAFFYRQVFITVNYDIPERYKNSVRTQVEFRRILDSPLVKTVSDILLKHDEERLGPLPYVYEFELSG